VSRPAQLRVFAKLADRVPYSLRRLPSSMPVVSGDIVLNALQRPCRRFRPSDLHDHLSSIFVEYSLHFGAAGEAAIIGCLDALFGSLDLPGLYFRELVDCLVDQVACPVA